MDSIRKLCKPQYKDFGKEVMLNAIRVKVYIERKSSK